MGIDDYVFRLRHLLRIPADGIVADVEGQLRELAKNHGEASAIAAFGSPEGAARRFHLQARRRATLQCMRMLVITGASLVAAALVVEVLHPETVWPRGQVPLGVQWKLTLAGMFMLTACAFGAGALWNRARDNCAVAIALATLALVAAIPAGAFHLMFQIDRLANSAHDKWFASLLAASAGIRIGMLTAGIVVVCQASRTFRAAEGTARERLRTGRALPRVRHA